MSTAAALVRATLVELRWRALLQARFQVAIATLAAAFLRFWDLDGVPPGLNQDEAMYGYDAYSILQTGRDHLGHPFPLTAMENFGDWSSPLLTYLNIPAIALFGLHVEVLRGVAALVGVAAIPLVATLAILLTRRNTIGVVAAWWLALSPFAVHLSRWAIIPTVVPTMLAATLVLLVWSLQTQNRRGMVSGVLLAALTVTSYHAMKVYVPLHLLAFVALYWKELRRLGLEPALYAGAIFLAIAGPIFYLTLRDPGGGARLAQTSVLNDQQLTPALLLDQYAGYFSPGFWFASGDGDPMHLPAGTGLEFWFLAPFLLIGLGHLLHTAVLGHGPLRQGAILILVAVVLYPVPGSMTTPSPHVLRAVHVLPLAVVTGAIGIVTVFDMIRRLELRWSGAWAVGTVGCAAFAILFMLSLVERYDHYFNRYPDQVQEQFHYGIGEALRYAFLVETQYDEVWIDENNSFYIYVLFYKRWQPSDVHRSLIVKRNPPDWNKVDGIGKYRFGSPPLIQNDTVVYSVPYNDGSVAFQVLDAVVDEKRLLVIQHATSPNTASDFASVE